MLTATSPPPEIAFEGDQLSVHFDRFDIATYDLFLRVKRLPEYRIRFDPADETYTVTAPARFATMLGVEQPQDLRADLPLSEFLYDDQREIVTTALAAKRYACWSGCGNGKTLIGLEYGRHVIHRTGGRVLIVSLNEIVPQWIEEAQRWYGDSLPIIRLKSRQEMRDWCKDGDPGLAITNYEKWNPRGLDDQIVSEARHLAGIIPDESSRLRTGGGKQKWSLIKSCKGIEYKLSLTATPAPNDVMEFASQASFLEKMRSEGEILWTFFTRDPVSHRWTVRPHARAAFFEFMAGWSIYVRDPKRFGWRLDQPDVPAPTIQVHEIPMTPEQQEYLARHTADPKTGQMSFLNDRATNTIERNRLSQVAKGFRYRKIKTASGKVGRRVAMIDSLKPQFVADLIRSEVADGLQVLVWTVFDAESEILAGLMGSQPFDLLTGKTKPAERLAILERFRSGKSPVLISRARMLGYGMNFQCCGSMIFSGFDDSYEAFYQAIRRAVRHGQTRSVRVHLPLVNELERDTLENLFRKEAENEASIAEMEANYLKATRALRGVA